MEEKLPFLDKAGVINIYFGFDDGYYLAIATE